MLDIDIRPMLDKDINYVMEIENLCFVAPWKSTDILNELHNNVYANILVVTANDIPIGFVDYWVTFESATICQIAIHPNYQKQNLGSMLMKEIESDCYAKRVINITLEVRAGNFKAINFYKKHGFKNTVIKKGYYSNGEDALYMLKVVSVL